MFEISAEGGFPAAIVRVANDPDFAHTLGARATLDIREMFSPEAVGKIIRAR